MEDAALFIRNIVNTNWTAANTDSVTPQILVGYDTSVVRSLRGGGFVNNGDVIYCKEVPNSYTATVNQIGLGWRMRVRVNVTCFTAASSATVSPQQHGRKLADEVERIIRANVQQASSAVYDYVNVIAGSNDSNLTNNWAKYTVVVELVTLNETS